MIRVHFRRDEIVWLLDKKPGGAQNATARLSNIERMNYLWNLGRVVDFVDFTELNVRISVEI